jgi:hypothetical protein
LAGWWVLTVHAWYKFYLIFDPDADAERVTAQHKNKNAKNQKMHNKLLILRKKNNLLFLYLI